MTMKTILVATAVAVLAGCAEIPESVKHPFAARGATTQTDTPDVGTAAQTANPYPYNPPYGN
jgi:starvation-inducible outer membrane lipoprotein